jgi:hypothetical protein
MRHGDHHHSSKTGARPGVPSRRAILRAAGASLALPFLPSLLPRSAWGAQQTAPMRILVAVVPNGIFTPAWQPQSLGAGYELPFILQPAAALQSRMTIVSGLQNYSEEEIFPEHEPAMGSLLTDTPVDQSATGTPNGISVDQVPADHQGALTPFRSLQFGVDNTGGGGSPYVNQVSWGNGDTPFPPIEDPRTMFNRMFGVDAGLTPEEAAAHKTIRSSILDRVRERTSGLKAQLGTSDKARLDQYETAVSELQAQLDRLDQIVCEVPETPGSNPGFAEATALQYDLMLRAFECDLTRSMTFLQGPSVSVQVYSHIGITTDHHTLSHSGWGGGQAETDLKNINNWQFEMFCGLMQSLADTEDVDGNDILSNTIAVFTSEFSDSNTHRAYDDYSLPVAIFGGENLGIAQGQHRQFPMESHGSLWLTLLHHMGIEQPTFGNYGTKVLSLA